jgi:acetyl coenzyme A synthetase (ADP forming)-like protein
VDGVDVLLADGSTARLRPLGPDDRHAVAALFAGLSKDSTVMRFFGPHRVTDSELDRLLAADGVDQAVLAVERANELVALAEYDRRPGSFDAEVAFVVADRFQGRGLGTLLLEHLAASARRAGIRRFVVDTLAINTRMLGVLRAAGFARQYERDATVTRVVLDIAPSPEAQQAAEERDRQATLRSMERLLRPRSIAVIGASRQPGTVGFELLRNLVTGGFTGPVYPVNPEATSVASLPAWPSIDAVPGPVDLAVIAVPAASVADVVEACGHAGVGGLVVISAGFAETGPAGAAAQLEVTRAAHRLGMRLIGPNCFGVVNADPAVSLNATFAAQVPPVGRIGFASQSGGLGIAILSEADRRGLGLSAFVSMGNKADVSSNDLLTWWEADPGTDVVLLYIESFGNPPKFSRLARRIGRTKPIVAVKSGRSGAGTRAASSHTAAPASPERAVDALFEQTGVIRVDTVEELFDVAAVLAQQPLPTGSRVGIVGNAGGPGVLAADAVVGHRLVVPELSAPLQAELHGFLPLEAGVGNPVDMVASATAETYRQAVDLLLRSGEVDAVIVLFTPPLVVRAPDVADAIVEVVDAAAEAGIDIPVVAAFLGADDVRHRLQHSRRPIPCFTYPESAARALAHAVRHSRWRQRPASEFPEFDDVRPNDARRILDETLETTAAARADSPGDAPGQRGPSSGGDVELPPEQTISGDAVRQVLACYGIGLGAVAPTGDLFDGATVTLRVTVTRDAVFGPLVVVGSGGRWAQVVDDTATGVAPLTVADARRLVLERRTSALLQGGGGVPPADVDGLIDVVLRLARLAEDLPEVTTVELDPVLAGPAGPVVSDARLTVAAVLDEPLASRPRQLR